MEESEVVKEKVVGKKVEDEKQEEIVPEVLEVEPVPLRYTLLNRVYGSKLTPQLKKFLMLVKSFGVTKDDVVSLNPNFLSSIFTGYSTFSYGGIDIHYLDGTKEIISALHLTKKDFLTSESYHLLASMLCVPDEHKNWDALGILVKDLGLTRQDVLSNSNVKYQIMASSDLMLKWLKEKGLIIDGDLDKIKRYEEILFN